MVEINSETKSIEKEKKMVEINSENEVETMGNRIRRLAKNTAYTLTWYPEKEKPEVITIRIHAKIGDEYIVEYLDKRFSSKKQVMHKSVIWFDHHEAQKVADMERTGDIDTTPEKCVLCGDKTPYVKADGIQYRKHYVEGVGQLCPMCDCKLDIHYSKQVSTLDGIAKWKTKQEIGEKK